MFSLFVRIQLLELELWWILVIDRSEGVNQHQSWGLEVMTPHFRVWVVGLHEILLYPIMQRCTTF